MRSSIRFGLATVMILTLVSFALAREAPNRKAFTAQAIVSVSVAPVVANVPPMAVGFDVILNIATANFAVKEQTATDTSVTKEQGTTGDERGFTATGYCLSRSGPAPRVVLLA